MKNTIFNIGLLAALLQVFNYVILFPQSHLYSVSDKILIGGETRWDYLSIDYSSNRLFLSHASRVHAIDLKTNKVVGEISDQHGVHGIEFAPEYSKGFISNGKDSSITVFDLKTLKIISNIKVDGKNPDAIIYDPFTKRIFAFNHSSNSATAIDAKTNSVVGNFALEGEPEFAASDSEGKMYVNLEDKNAVNVIDTKELKVLDKWSIAPCEGPTGMAIDRKDKRLFVVGSNKIMAVLNLATGKVNSSAPIGTGVDGCAYDPQTHLVFSSNGEGSITVIKQETPDNYSVAETIPTAKGARTITIDTNTHKVYTTAMLEQETHNETDDKSIDKLFGVIVLDYNKPTSR